MNRLKIYFDIRWKGIPHTDLALPHGSWKFAEGSGFGAMIYQMVFVAREMNMTLSDFMALPQDEKAIQMVASQIRSKIEQVSVQEQRDKANKKK